MTKQIVKAGEDLCDGEHCEKIGCPKVLKLEKLNQIRTKFN